MVAGVENGIAFFTRFVFEYFRPNNKLCMNFHMKNVCIVHVFFLVIFVRWRIFVLRGINIFFFNFINVNFTVTIVVNFIMVRCFTILKRIVNWSMKSTKNMPRNIFRLISFIFCKYQINVIFRK